MYVYMLYLCVYTQEGMLGGARGGCFIGIYTYIYIICGLSSLAKRKKMMTLCSVYEFYKPILMEHVSPKIRGADIQTSGVIHR